MADKTYLYVWTDLIARLRSEPPDTVIEVPVADILHPLDAGMRRLDTTTEDRRPQFLLVVDEKQACHVLVCGNWYTVRLYTHRLARIAQPSPAEVIDRDSAPARKPETPLSSLSKLVADHPSVALGCATILGAVAGASCSTKKKRSSGAATGSGIGLLVGLAMVAVETANTSPRTSEVAQGLFFTLATAGITGRPAGRVIRLTSSARPAPKTGTASTAKAKKKPRSNELPI